MVDGAAVERFRRHFGWTATAGSTTRRLRWTAVIAVLSVLSGGAGATVGFPGVASAAGAQPQNVVAVTTTATPVSAGLVAVPANPATQFAIVTPPANGTATVTGATFTYTPAKGFVGVDAFSYARPTVGESRRRPPSASR